MIECATFSRETMLSDNMKKNPKLYVLFMHCVYNMSTKFDIKFVRGSYEQIYPGDYPCTLSEVARACRQTKSQVQYGLDMLMDMGLIQHFSDGTYTLIYVNEWDKYLSESNIHAEGTD